MRTGEVFALTWDDIDLENKIIKINKTVYSKIKDDKGRWFLGTTKTNYSYREVFICDTLYKVLSNYKEKQELLKKKYGRKYKKYELELIKNEYGKINEYKVIESKHKNLNSVEIVFTKNNGSYVGTDIIVVFVFKIDNPTYQKSEDGEIQCIEARKVKQKIRAEYAPKIDSYFFDNLIHISDNIEESKRTLDTINNYEEYTIRDYVRKGYKPIIKEKNKKKSKSYVSFLKELKEDNNERK